jgi:hypothetical protein
METADMGLGRPDASVGESGRGEVVVSEVEIAANRSSSCSSWSAPRPINRGRTPCSPELLAQELVNARAEFGAGAIVASVGAHDRILDELLASPEQRERIDRLLAERVAASIVTSETAYRLILAYCDEEFGRRPDRMRYRIVTSDVVPYSRATRQQPTPNRER